MTVRIKPVRPDDPLDALRQTPGAPVSNQEDQKITALTDADQQRLREQRAVVEAYLGSENSKQNHRTAAGKLGTIRAFLQGGVCTASQTYELQCLGTLLGDAFVQDMTMISKRVERGENVDVFDLYNGSASQVEALRDSAK